MTATPPTRLPELMEMLEAGVHFGHERSKRNPKMEPFIFTQRNRISIIDLEQAQQKLAEATQFIFELCQKTSKEILFVGTKRQARDIVRKYAEHSNMPYVTKRWLGGTLTNFATILKSIEKLEELKSMSATSQWEKLTKKERAVINKEIDRLEQVLEGIKTMRTLPSAVFVIGAHNEKLAVHEARRMHIPVIGIVDTNANPALLDYPIPGNDDALRAIELVVGTITNAILVAKGKAPVYEKKEESKSKVETISSQEHI
jgi:small subunit ribosomal protein S2